jgi:predicted metal-dependent HD superfamily phosphohydrolase
MSNKDILKKTEHYVTGLFETMKDDHLVFHNLKHTQTVVKRAEEIGKYYNLAERDSTIIYIAAWFHDTGHLFTEPEKHEEMGVDVMRKFMDENSSDAEMPNEIAECIMATKFPRHPKNLLSQIICDADTYHFGTKEFKKTNKQVRQEDELRGHHWDKKDYITSTLSFLEQHVFYTDYCKQLLTEQKELNMKKLKNKLEKDIAEMKAEPEKDKLSELEKDKSGLVSKGIQTMLRLTSGNHLKLSEMADHKASILISVNSIIISVILGVLVRKLQEEPFLEIPTIIFLVVAVSVIVISILATRPQLGAGRFTSQDVQDKKTNLLFFGNFYKASYEEYSTAMKSLMVDTDYLYDSLVKDIYYLAVVLGRKYRLIRLAYNIFMFGIIITVLAFVIAFTFYHGAAATNPVVNGAGSPL